MIMKMIYRYICVLCAAVAGFSAAAQNLDPTVVVDREYEGKLMEVHKPALQMAVPDSVTRFDLDFDYSVFESPYKGSYEFNPYLLSMKPSAATEAPGKLYLRAGAGYHLHPELDLVWSPQLLKHDSGLSMDVYARHRSFVGKYWALEPDAGMVIRHTDLTTPGYDLDSRAGVNVKYDWSMGDASVDLSYYGLHLGFNESENSSRRGYNALDLSFAVGSKPNVTHFIYGVDGKYRYAHDGSTSAAGRSALHEHNFNLDASLGYLLFGRDKALVSLGTDVAGYFGYVLDAASSFYLTPHYVLNRGRLKADIGVRIMGTTVNADEPTDFTKNAKEQIVYPDVNVRYSILPDQLVAYFKAGGGSYLNSLSSMLERNRFASVEGINGLVPTYHMGVCIERLSLVAGVEGRLGKRFSWNLNGGYANYASGVLDALMYFQYSGTDIETNETYEIRALSCGIEYAPYQKAFVSLDARWNNDRFAADGTVTYTGTWGEAFKDSAYCIKPAALTGDVSFEYNYRRRIFVGVDCAFSTAMKGVLNPIVVPGYADLGVSAEYVTSRKLSFWLKGGNLLGMTIARELITAQKGPYFTAGICLNL